MKRDHLLTVNEAAQAKGVTRQAIWAAIKAKRLAVVQRKRVTVETRIDPAVLAEFEVNPNMRNGRTGRPSTKQ